MIHTDTNRKAPTPTKVEGAFQITNTVDFPTTAQKNKSVAHQIGRLALAGHAVLNATQN